MLLIPVPQTLSIEAHEFSKDLGTLGFQLIIIIIIIIFYIFITFNWNQCITGHTNWAKHWCQHQITKETPVLMNEGEIFLQNFCIRAREPQRDPSNARLYEYRIWYFVFFCSFLCSIGNENMLKIFHIIVVLFMAEKVGTFTKPHLH